MSVREGGRGWELDGAEAEAERKGEKRTIGRPYVDEVSHAAAWRAHDLQLRPYTTEDRIRSPSELILTLQLPTHKPPTIDATSLRCLYLCEVDGAVWVGVRVEPKASSAMRLWV